MTYFSSVHSNHSFYTFPALKFVQCLGVFPEESPPSWPCPIAQSVERLGRSDSDTELAGAGSNPGRGERSLPPHLNGTELWAHSRVEKGKRAVGSFPDPEKSCGLILWRLRELEAKARGTQPFRGMQMENCCKEQPEKGSSP